MEDGEGNISVSSVRSNTEEQKNSSERFDGYDPDIMDFLRRCENDKQAGEIIAYMEKKREISSEYAQRLKKQLKEKGVRSFGKKKEEQYYLKRAGY